MQPNFNKQKKSELYSVPTFFFFYTLYCAGQNNNGGHCNWIKGLKEMLNLREGATKNLKFISKKRYTALTKRNKTFRPLSMPSSDIL